MPRKRIQGARAEMATGHALEPVKASGNHGSHEISVLTRKRQPEAARPDSVGRGQGVPAACKGQSYKDLPPLRERHSHVAFGLLRYGSNGASRACMKE